MTADAYIAKLKTEVATRALPDKKKAAPEPTAAAPAPAAPTTPTPAASPL
jgi:hypothetical protein